MGLHEIHILYQCVLPHTGPWHSQTVLQMEMISIPSIYIDVKNVFFVFYFFGKKRFLFRFLFLKIKNDFVIFFNFFTFLYNLSIIIFNCFYFMLTFLIIDNTGGPLL